MRLAIILILAALLSFAQQRPQQQQQSQLDVSESLFAVMAGAMAGGYEPEIDSPTNHPLRKALDDHFKALKLDVGPELRRFVRDHKQYSQYVAYGLTIAGPPDFAFKLDRLALPPEVDAMQEFTPLLIRFYRDAKIEELWQKLQPTFEQALQPYQGPISRAAL